MNRIILVIFIFFPFLSFSQLNYPSYIELTQKINRLKANSFLSVSSIGKSFVNEDIPILKLQNSNESKPTILLVAGIDGKHPAGIWSALEVVDQILALKKDSLTAVLNNYAIWVVPILNPDAYKRNSAKGFWSSGNSRTIDNDRDGRIDEDPVKDLNNDGVIAQMRVKSAVGQYNIHDFNERIQLMTVVDKTKGEIGAYNLFNEGLDLDFDGSFSEDGDAGVNIDRNFTFNYQAFLSEGGDYAASELETRAIVDFVFDNPQISTIIHFGLANNLSEPEKFDGQRASNRIVNSWYGPDVEVSKYVSGIYNQAVKGLGSPEKFEQHPGNFTNTAYYHLGKFSFATPAWWPSVPDSIKSIKKENVPAELNHVFYQWVQHNNIQGAILPWTKVNHPNFPHTEVEVGGVVDVFKHNPPIQYLEPYAKAHANFLLNLTESLPKLEFSTPIITPLGNDIFRVEIDAMNVGKMAIYPAIGDRIKFVSKFKTICDLQVNQSFLSGKRLQLYSSLGAGASQKFSWLIKGKGTVKIKAGCPTAGEKLIEVKL